jgi:hypothetical protein
MTQARNEWLIREYLQVLKRHGKYASRLTKRELYEEAAVPFFISVSHAQHLIEDMLRTRPEPFLYCIEEIEAMETAFKTFRKDE